MTKHDTERTSKPLPPLNPRPGRGPISALYEDLSRDPDITDTDLMVRAQLARYGERVRAARKRKGLTQKQLSDAIAITQARISKIESGTMDEGPTFRTMARIERILGVEAVTFERLPSEDLLVDPALFSLPEDEQSTVLAEAVKVKEAALAGSSSGESVRPIGVRMVKSKEKQSSTSFEVVAVDDVQSSFPHGCIPINGFVREIAMAMGITSTLNSTMNFLVLKRNPEDKFFAVSMIR